MSLLRQQGKLPHGTQGGSKKNNSRFFKKKSQNARLRSRGVHLKCSPPCMWQDRREEPEGKCHQNFDVTGPAMFFFPRLREVCSNFVATSSLHKPHFSTTSTQSNTSRLLLPSLRGFDSTLLTEPCSLPGHHARGQGSSWVLPNIDENSQDS